MNIWRISDHHELLGKGGLRASGRWHTRGARIVYLADSPAGALLEVLVHLELDSEDIPDGFSLLKVSVPDAIEIKLFDFSFGGDWKLELEVTRQMGDAWLKSGATALARVPSAIVAESWNYLLNPEHPIAAQIEVAMIIQEEYDRRLFRFGTR